MRGTSLIATAAAIGVTLLVVSCGQQHAPGSGTAGVAPSGSAQARCVTPKLTSPGRSFTITDKDNGKSFCVTAGTGVFIFLHGAPVRMWAQIKPSSAAIQPRPSGKMTLARGVTGGYFVATRTGAAFLMSVRTPCRVRTALASASHCTVQSEFRVKLVIRGKA